MRRTQSETVSDVVWQYLREQGLEMPLNQYRIIQAWNSVMGKTVSRYTSNLEIHNQTLYVTMTSASLKNEIMMRRTELAKALNAYVGAQVISSIIVK